MLRTQRNNVPSGNKWLSELLQTSSFDMTLDSFTHVAIISEFYDLVRNLLRNTDTLPQYVFVTM